MTKCELFQQLGPC
uniref:Uncharacterized protein n=1 Tax=Anguilla anguilla TaxID=7936 RepID=A0A0E9PA52_ANGAN